MPHRGHRVPGLTLLSYYGAALCIHAAVVLASLEQDLLKEARLDHDWTVQHRRALHQIPELKYEEHATSLYLR